MCTDSLALRAKMSPFYKYFSCHAVIRDTFDIEGLYSALKLTWLLVFCIYSAILLFSVIYITWMNILPV